MLPSRSGRPLRFTLSYLPTASSSCNRRLIDRPGLLTTGVELSEAQKSYARNKSEWGDKGTDLLGVINGVQPNVLIGTSGRTGAFKKEAIEAMAKHVDRPIILPLSNPVRLHEAVPEDLLNWTGGRALVATGSPFKPVKGPFGQGGKEREVEIAECNNAIVFPGIGLGSVLSRARLITDKMLVAAVTGVADVAPALEDDAAPLLPDVTTSRDVSVRVARNVIRAAIEDGVATERDIPAEDGELEAWVREQMWNPVYRPLKYVEPAGASRQAKGEMRVVGTVGREG